MALLSILFLFAMRRDIAKAKWMKWVPWVIILPYIANICGWLVTEMGRQPWIVQGLLKVQDAVSPNLTTVDLLISLIGYVVVYGSLAVADFYRPSRSGCGDDRIGGCRAFRCRRAGLIGGGSTCLTNFFKFYGSS
jgi:cytochrome bd-type quinol oxidase subunit 1